ncbi:hypothetical protein TVAG_418550 [Trichomonas vaginalis G3]|uniref:Uncharacterized protein n=1 Tax=Trichomonas vaginalis (strain ATCC PRA-98 / G3) TaxID=412133 RepID=A2E7C5_TRIV3|nr:hypothetical protein TVAGG3_0831720 [Trichomonas vaginalis G3]EAY11418.1 hypothetical protein TVAG_418550 [Trichomonas vaginalis G3]KAI5498625.1 hypothetical protein TVAGG3_0831720 [Trichomonas vaginalis G3]|eukprot:XP_001323641.1 hypothetical protein [Trichomonas vaginalis G3]
MLNSKSIDSIIELVKNSDSTLSKFVHEANAVKSIASKQDIIHDFIKQHFKTLIDCALNTNSSLDAKEQSYYDLVIRAYAERFPLDVTNCEYFFDKVLEFAKPESPERTLICIAETFLSILRSKNQAAISVFAMHPQIFESLIQSIHYNSIFESLRMISIQNNPSLNLLYEQIMISEILYNQLFIQKSYRVAIILSNIIGILAIPSNNISFFCSQQRLDQLLALTYDTNDAILASGCLKFFYSLLIQVEYAKSSDIDSDSSEYDDSDNLYEISDFFEARFPQFTNFAMSNKPFAYDKGSAITLITRLIPFLKTNIEPASHLLDYLFELTISNPCQSMIHNAFLSTFEACKNTGIDLNEFDKRCQVKSRIAHIFNKRHYVLANFWAHLHAVAKELISDTECYSTDDDSERSDAFTQPPATNQENSLIAQQDYVQMPLMTNEDILGDSDDEEIISDPGDLTLNYNDNAIVTPPVDSPARERAISLSPMSMGNNIYDMHPFLTPAPPIPAFDKPFSGLVTNQRAQSFSTTLSIADIGPPPPIPTLPVITMSPASSLRAKKFEESPPDDPCDANSWRKFVKGQFAQMSEIMSNDYGGPLPGDAQDNLFDLGTSDEDDLY